MKNKLEIDKVATIDIGSNAIRLLISNVFSVNGKLHHTKNSLYRVQLRLGDDSFNKGIISPKNLDKLKLEIYKFTKHKDFKNSVSMGDLMDASLSFLKRNYKNIKPISLLRN